jgi:hypothetical protein
VLTSQPASNKSEKQRANFTTDTSTLLSMLAFTDGKWLEDNEYLAVAKYLRAQYQLKTEPTLRLLRKMTKYANAKGKHPNQYRKFKTFVQDHKDSEDEADDQDDEVGLSVHENIGAKTISVGAESSVRGLSREGKKRSQQSDEQKDAMGVESQELKRARKNEIWIELD